MSSYTAALQPGENVIAIQGSDAGGIASLLLPGPIGSTIGIGTTVHSALAIAPLGDTIKSLQFQRSRAEAHYKKASGSPSKPATWPQAY